MKKRILIIDDFENTRFVIGFTLKQKGYEVLEAENGQDGLKILSSQAVDLIISDLNMPVMNGIEFTKVVRKNEEHRRIPIIMLTTEISEEKKEAAKAAGVTWWIKKPFETNSFLKVIEKAL